MTEETTKDLPDDEQKAATTRVMLEMILVKVSDLSASRGARFDAVEKEIREIKRDIRTLNDQTWSLHGRVRDVEDLEKAS